MTRTALLESALVLAFLAGAALVAAGAWSVYPPAGLVVAGLFLLVVPILYVRGRAVAGS